MIRIACPHCGLRNSDEFRYGGDASVRRPAHDDPDQDAWFRYVYLRDNPAGPISEYWYHVSGCRSWLVVERDTRSHAVIGARLAGERER